MTSIDLTQLSIEELKNIYKKQNKVFREDVEQYRNREKQKNN